MNEKNDDFQLPPGLVNLPPEILERARAALPSGAGVEELTALVVEALGEHLDQLERPARVTRRRAQPSRELFFNQVFSASEPATTGWRPSRRIAAEFESPAEETRIALEAIEGPSRQVFLSSYEQIDDFQNALARGGRPEAVEEILGRVTAWAGIEPVRLEPLSPDGEVREAGKKKPIFGFHNRDYVSLWALELLARATPQEPVLWSEFAPGLNLLARKFGGLLRELDRIPSAGELRPRRLRFATSFPDPGKPNEAGGGQWLFSPDGERRERLFPFVKNNFGRVQKRGNTVTAAGPLPQWRAVAFRPEGRDYLVGVTEHGVELLETTAGASIDLPHPPQAARGFVEYLRANAPEDWQGFRRVIQAVAERPDRDALVRANKEFFDSFRETRSDPEDVRFASSMTQGYVSRGREWGLIAPELAPSEEGKHVLYEPTGLGQEMIALDD